MLKNSFVYFLFILTACASGSNRGNGTLAISQFEIIKNGDNAQKIVSILGNPTEIRRNLKNSSDELWIYDDKNNSQRGAVSLDPKTQAVTAVMVIPREDEKEYHLDFLLKNKFVLISFETVPLLRCQRDFLPQQVFYINSEKGILIEVHRKTNEVESFSWTSPQYASELIKNIKNCRR